MKKLLTILSSFAVTAAGASTVVACGSKDGEEDAAIVDEDQKKLDAAVAEVQKLNGKEIQLPNNANKGSNLIDKIKAEANYNNAINKNGVVLKNGTDLTLKSDKTDIKTDTVVADKDSITVSGKFTAGDKDKDFTFTVKIKLVNPNELKADEAVKALKEITSKNTILNLVAGADKGSDLITEIKKAEGKFAKIVTGDVKLIGKLTLKSDSTDIKDDSVLKDDSVITVSGTIKVGDQEKTFTFTVTVKVVDADKKKVDDAVAILNTISEEEIKLPTADLTVGKLIEGIKALKKYANTFKDGVSLKDNKFTLENPKDTPLATDADTKVKNDDVITVKGSVEAGTSTKKEASFSFTVKVKEQQDEQKDEQQEAANKAAEALNNIKDKEVKLATADLNVTKLTEAIKDLEEYKAVVGQKGVTLKDDLKFKVDKTDISDDEGVSTAKGKDVTVEGKVQVGENDTIKEASFSFKIKLTEQKTS